MSNPKPPKNQVLMPEIEKEEELGRKKAMTLKKS